MVCCQCWLSVCKILIRFNMYVSSYGEIHPFLHDVEYWQMWTAHVVHAWWWMSFSVVISFMHAWCWTSVVVNAFMHTCWWTLSSVRKFMHAWCWTSPDVNAFMHVWCWALIRPLWKRLYMPSTWGVWSREFQAREMRNIVCWEESVQSASVTFGAVANMSFHHTF